MTTTNTISAEGRKRVAAACGCPVGAAVLNPNWYHEYKINYQALVQKAAQLIERLQKHEADIYDYLERFNSAIATNNVNAIEQLVLELLEGKE